MFHLSLGSDALTLASHAALSVALLFLLGQMVTMLDGGVPKIAIQRGLVAGLAIMLLGLLVERLYYAVARLLRSQGLDLWQMHPGPEVLSFLVCLTLYALKVPLYLALYPRRKAYLRLSMELLILTALWGAIVTVFY